jgi:SsrA-binding protein
MLEGWEVASLRSNCIIDVAFCAFNDNSLKLYNCKITPEHNHVLQNKNITNNESRERTLLLNKSELKKIKDNLDLKGFTCIPCKIYKNENNLWKVDIAVVTGKKLYDKRQDIKKRDLDRDSKREN